MSVELWVGFFALLCSASYRKGSIGRALWCTDLTGIAPEGRLVLYLRRDIKARNLWNVQRGLWATSSCVTTVQTHFCMIKASLHFFFKFDSCFSTDLWNVQSVNCGYEFESTDFMGEILLKICRRTIWTALLYFNVFEGLVVAICLNVLHIRFCLNDIYVLVYISVFDFCWTFLLRSSSQTVVDMETTCLYIYRYICVLQYRTDRVSAAK